MARRTKTVLIDDVDGEEAVESVSFALDGVRYEVDLGETNAAALRENFARWAQAGRRVGGRAKRGTRGGVAHSRETAKIREWARANGHQVSDRGRISAKVQEAYKAAH